jgi:hypothetical protein
LRLRGILVFNGLLILASQEVSIRHKLNLDAISILKYFLLGNYFTKDGEIASGSEKFSYISISFSRKVFIFHAFIVLLTPGFTYSVLMTLNLRKSSLNIV